MKLREATAHLDEIPNINSGGCAIAALALYRLTKSKYPSIEIYIARIGNYLDDEACTHVGLYYKGLFIDSTGALTLEDALEEWAVSEHELIDEDRAAEIIEYGDWNTMFERRSNVPKIVRALQVKLDDISL